MKKFIFMILVVQNVLLSQAENYFPVHIGDTFSWQENDIDSNYKTYDTTKITNIITKSDGGLDIYYNNSVDPRYYKATNGNIYQYADHKPYLWYDFTVASQDTYYTKLSGTDYRVVVYYDMATIFGKTINARRFMFYHKNSHMMNGNCILGEDFGQIEANSYILFPSTATLIGCIIDGKEYGTMVGINNPLEEIPNNLKLSQNYPNPFNPTTTIEYEIPRRGNVLIIVYDILGRRIKELFNEEKNTGKYSITWNGKDNNDNNVSSGTYFYQIISGNNIRTKKMVLLK
jgi:hypothetical protein